MKISNILPLIILLFLPAAVVAGGKVSSAVRTEELRITLDPSAHRLRVESLLTIAPGVERLSLMLNPRSTVTGVTFKGAPLSYRFAEGALEVTIPPAAPSGRVIIRYGCDFNDPVPRQYASSEDPTYGITGIVSPEGTFLSDSALWYPHLAEPPPQLTVTITAPAGTEAITAGKRLRHATEAGVTTSVWEIREPLSSIPLSAGPYRIAERRVAGIAVYTYLYPANAGLAKRYLAAAGKYLAFYQKLFGPYPYPKFAVVENFFPSGYGFPSYTLIGGSVLKLPFIADTSLPHEIAHSWWGNGVGVGPGGNWSEGLVTYLADYLQETRRSPESAPGYRFRILAEYASVTTPGRDFPLKEFDRRLDTASHAVGYGKGAMVFHMVRQFVGDDAFYAGLRRVVAEKLFDTATWDDFARVFSATSGKNVGAFMAPWLDRPGGPRLSFAGVTRRQEKEGWLVSGVLKQEGPAFEGTVVVRAETPNGREDFPFRFAGGETPFSFVVADTPKRLVLDPDYDLFRLLDRREVPTTVNRLKGSRSLTAVVTDGCQADGEALRGLLVSLGQEKGVVLREQEVTPEVLRKGDILYCGVPSGAGLLPPLPKGVAVSPEGFGIDGRRFSRRDEALFIALTDPAAADRTVGLFLPLSAAAAARCAAKITHYGKFTYLVFANGDNRLKGVFPAGRGGAEFEF